MQEKEPSILASLGIDPTVTDGSRFWFELPE